MPSRGRSIAVKQLGPLLTPAKTTSEDLRLHGLRMF